MPVEVGVVDPLECKTRLIWTTTRYTRILPFELCDHISFESKASCIHVDVDSSGKMRFFLFFDLSVQVIE